MKNAKEFRESLLKWFDCYGRDLPWRVKGGVQDVYHVWLSEIMLQQTTVQAVIPYYLKFTEQWPSIADLAAAQDDDVMQAWAGLGYYSRARNLLKCARMVMDEYNGVFPDDPSVLPGIGPYTSGAIQAIARNQAAVVVDGNVERIAARVFSIETPIPKAKPIIHDKVTPFMVVEDGRQSDFVQAMMDLGAIICTPKSPKCGICPVKDFCTAQQPENFPCREKKKPKPHREGRVFIIVNAAGEIAIEKRHEDVMLGGMWGLPSTTWHDKENPEAGIMVGSVSMKRHVRHVFTHFSLNLHLHRVALQDITPDKNWRFVSYNKLQEMGLPSLYQKVVKMIEFQEL